eukprot:Nk52_evm34s1705 gene=Nk52_evmTU34s1705
MGNQVSFNTLNVQNFEAGEQFGLNLSFTYERSLSSTRFLKVVRVGHAEGTLVLKIFSKPGGAQQGNYDVFINKLEEIRELLSNCHNIIACSYISETDRVVCTGRQYAANNLYDRISTRPFLSLIEKKCICYQILCSLKECHSNKVVHGDIKAENILVTTFNWVLLCDFACYKPTYLPVDNPASFSFFFDTSGRRSCYVAPERFYHPSDENSENVLLGKRSAFGPMDEFREGELTPAMDIFSAGCVIAELFNDGIPLFDLSQLLLYRKGEYYPSKVLEKIKDPDIRELIEHMIQLDSEKRFSAQNYLMMWKHKAFPPELYDEIYPFMKRFSSCNSADENVKYLKKQFSFIFTRLMDEKKKKTRVSVEHLEGLSYKTGRFISTANMQDEEYKLQDFDEGGDEGSSSYNMTNVNTIDSMVILISLVTHCVRSLRFSSSKLSALSLMLEMARYTDDVFIIDRIVPYVIVLLSDKLGTVRSAALRTLTQVLQLIKYVPPSDANIFPEYILPSIAYFVADEDVLTRVTYAENIASLAETGLKFLEISSLRNSKNIDFDDNISSSALPYHGSYDTEKVALQEMVQEQVVKILCDPESIVKQTILADITRLCIFFGRQKTSEVLLGHIITYLNDRDWRLKCAFYKSIVGVSMYVGGRGLESYILPLLTKGLTDMEEFVVEVALKSLTGLAELGLFNKSTLRNLSVSIAPMLCHPGNWVRFGAVNFFTMVAKRFSITDLHCILLPILKPFLKYEIADLRNDIVLLESLKSPLSRQIYDHVVGLLGIERFFDVLLKRQLTRNTNGSNAKLPSNISNPSGPDEGTHHIFELLWKMGMDEEEENKIISMEDYLSLMSCKQNIPSNEDEDDDGWKLKDYLEGNINLTNLKIKIYKAELDPKDNDFVKVDRAETSLQYNKSDPFWFETENIFSYDGSSFAPSPHRDSSYCKESGGHEMGASASTSTGGKAKETTDVPNCKEELQRLIWEKQMEMFPPSAPSNLGIINVEPLQSPKKKTTFRPFDLWEPQGIHVAHLNEHNGPITRLEVCKDGLFFVSGSNDGTVKIWDCGRLESNVSNRSRHTYSRHGGKITALTMCENSYSIASASDNGSVHVYRVEHTARPNTSSGLPKYGGFASILHRSVDTEVDGCVVDIKHFNRDLPSVLSYATVRGNIYGYDLRSNKGIWKLENEPSQGLIRSYIVSRCSNWLCLGTGDGVMTIWDIRFQLPIKSWVYPRGLPIHRIQRFNADNRNWVVVAAGSNELSCWDVESGECKQVMRVSESSGDILSGNDIDMTPGSWASRMANLKQSLSSPVSDAQTNPIRAIVCPNGNYIISGGNDRKLKYWNLQTASNSYTVSGPEEKHRRSHRTFISPSGVSVIEEGPFNEYTSSSSVHYGTSRGDARWSRSPGPGRGKPSTTLSSSSTGHRDAICDVNVLTFPQPMVVSGGRDGVIKVWK